MRPRQTLAAKAFLVAFAGALLFLLTAAQAQFDRPLIRVRSGTDTVYSGGTFDFGTTGVGQPVDRELRIHNDGTADLRIGEIAVPAGFTVTSRPSAAVPGRGSGALVVRVDAATPGAYSGLLTFSHNGANATSPFEVTVSATVEAAGEPRIRVQNGPNVIANGGGFDFGTTEIGRPLGRQFWIYSDGKGTLRLGSVSVPGGYSVSTPPPAEIPAGGKAAFSVRLDADRTGTHSGTVTFSHNGENASSPFEFRVSGTVPAAGNPRIRVQHGSNTIQSRGAFELGTTESGRPLGRELRIFNDGNADLHLSDLELPEGFSVIAPLPPKVPAGGSAAFSIRLNADMPGTHSGTLSFRHDATDATSPFEIAISGTVPAAGRPAIRVQHGGTVIANGGYFDFGTTRVGEPAGRQFRVFNDGVGELSLGSVSVPEGFALVGRLPASVPAGGEATFSVRLEAERAGSYSGKVSFRHGAANTASPLEFTIAGTVN